MSPRPFAALLLLLVAACGVTEEDKRTLEDKPKLDAITETRLSEVMLTLADSGASVEYFRGAVGRDPENVDLRRGLAAALTRDGQNREAVAVYAGLHDDGDARPPDLTLYAAALARLDRWDEAEAVLGAQPEDYATARQQTLRGMIADQRGDWPGADVHYETARSIAADPAPVHNNIGVSMLARRDFDAAAASFRAALDHDPTMFAAKNNLALTFALQKRYVLPLMPMDEEERSILLHNVALQALRNGDRDQAISLLRRAVDTHPRRWPPAAEKLAALLNEAPS